MEDYKFHREIKKIGIIINEMRNALTRENVTLECGKKLCKSGKKLHELSKMLDETTTELIDKGFLMNMNNKDCITKVQVFWICIVMSSLFLFIGMSIGIGYMAIADLESAVYEGKYYTTGKGLINEQRQKDR